MIEINKWEDIEDSKNYEDILYLEHPTSKNHPRQPRSARAGQFSPFDALTGYKEIIKETSKIKEIKKEIEEESKQELDYIIQKILKQNMKTKIRITYYKKEKNNMNGKYEIQVGFFHKIDTIKQVLELRDKIKIPIKDIIKIEIIDTQE